jgi:hypothetical protein
MQRVLLQARSLDIFRTASHMTQVLHRGRSKARQAERRYHSCSISVALDTSLVQRLLEQPLVVPQVIWRKFSTAEEARPDNGTPGPLSTSSNTLNLWIKSPHIRYKKVLEHRTRWFVRRLLRSIDNKAKETWSERGRSKISFFSVFSSEPVFTKVLEDEL